MSVGCRLTKVCRRELNSEYLLRTSRSYDRCEPITVLLSCIPRSMVTNRGTYACPDCVYNVAAPILVALPSIHNEYLKFRMLV